MERDVTEITQRILERQGTSQPEEESTTTSSKVATQDQVHKWLQQSGVNARKFGCKNFDRFSPVPDREALDAAKSFVQSFLGGARPSLYLYSTRPGDRLAAGCGKTHLAVAIMRTLMETSPETRKMMAFAYVPDLVDDYRRQYDEDAPPENLDQKYILPELLVLDDFGAQRLTTYAVEVINRVVYKREGRSTIYTSNLSLDEVDAKDDSGYIERATSRISEARVVKLVGPDRRLQRTA